MVNRIFPEKEFEKSRKAGLKHATTHFVGLAQFFCVSGPIVHTVIIPIKGVRRGPQ